MRKALHRASKLASMGGVPVLALLLSPGCVAYGPQPVYGVQDCDDITDPPEACVYDQDCVDEHGDGWYCDENALWDDGCEVYEHPQCVDGNEE